MCQNRSESVGIGGKWGKQCEKMVKTVKIGQKMANIIKNRRKSNSVLIGLNSIFAIENVLHNLTRFGREIRKLEIIFYHLAKIYENRPKIGRFSFSGLAGDTYLIATYYKNWNITKKI